MDSSVVSMLCSVRRYVKFAHIDGLIPADPAVYARLPKVQRDESRTQGLDRLELIRFLQVAQTVTVHHGAVAYLLGINALRASEAAAVRIEDYAESLRGHRVLRLVGKGNKPATMPITVPVLRVLEACRGERTSGPLVLRPLTGNPIDRRDAYRMVTKIAKAAGIPGTSAPTRYGTPRSPTHWTPGCHCATRRSWPATPTPGPPSTTTAPAATSTGTPCTSSPPTSPASDLTPRGPAQCHLPRAAAMSSTRGSLRATAITSSYASSSGASSVTSFNPKNTTVASHPRRLLPSTKAWLRTTDSSRTAALVSRSG